jgi:hypothetical protein
VPSWGRPPRGRWPAPSLSDRGEDGCRPWHRQLQRAWLSDPSGFGAALGAGFRHGSWKRFFHRRDSQDRPRADLQLYGLLLVLASRVLGMGRGLLAAAPVLRSSLPLFAPRSRSRRRRRCWSGRRRAVRRSSVAPQAPSPIEWGCSYLRRWNRSSVCNGTLNASVFVHCGCRGLNMYVFLARSRVFSSFSSAKTRLLVVRTASPSVSRPV